MSNIESFTIPAAGSVATAVQTCDVRISGTQSTETGSGDTGRSIVDTVREAQLRLATMNFVNTYLEVDDIACALDSSFSYRIEVPTGYRDVEMVTMDIQVNINGADAGNLNDSRVLNSLGIPEATPRRYMADEEVMELIGDVLKQKICELCSITAGVDGVVRVVRHWDSDGSSDIHSVLESHLYVTYCDVDLRPMSVSDFGNFLHAVKHNGNDVALATLHRIYNEANQ
jgi:hypothetical protein